uniref:Cytochrome P450 82A4 n=2 Tax=Cajanus cajan TaxID=3821 RepID=A0A151RRZ9_CAJCA|nr:Cytochrome P450 82A4 [Cajanus cajan]
MDLQDSRGLFTIFLGVLLFLFVVSSLWRRRRVENRKAPPEASGAWPLIGHLHLLVGSQPPHVTLGNMADKHGPIFTLRLGVHKTLIVSNWEMAKQCFTVNDKAFASRPKTLATELLGYNFSMFGFSPYGSYWRQVRKIVTTELLSIHRVDMLKHLMESEVKAVFKESYKNYSKKGVTEMQRWFGDISFNIIFRAMLGKRFASDDKHEENEQIRRVMRDFVELAGTFAVSDALPYLRWLDLDGVEKKMKKTAKGVDGFVQVWLDEHKRNRSRDSGERKDEDFMDVLLTLVDEGEDFDGRDIDSAIKATCMALIIAGTDTTIGTLTWALSLLLNNREILNKAVHELDAKVGREKVVDLSDLTKLEYMQSIIKETLRLYPPAPLNLIHESMEDCIVGGYHVSTGTRLLTNISKLQRDPLLYPNPSEFRPERFLTTHRDIDFKGRHFELIPFGAGRRMCSGMYFSLQVMQLTLATLLHGFDIITPDAKSVHMSEQIGLTSIKASPLQVILTPRLSTHIYDEI